MEFNTDINEETKPGDTGSDSQQNMTKNETLIRDRDTINSNDGIEEVSEPPQNES